MSWKKFAAGVGAGVAVTVLAKQQMDRSDLGLSAEKALKLVKKQASEMGTLEGSWVHMVTEKFETDNLVYNVYRGGVTLADEDGKIVAYDFNVDASTGTILSLEKQ
ncbi:PepSY domain-containing protein [Salisediminibacterium beveridgei]|uniref:PepSY domain-containing protein n=1 Tax=Salisediminibacterium beveridgei TaxID=632773 RepID=UPI0008481C55|nr:PepSY domain-containing protein [Salisediminibacterium beveridgei]